MKSKELEKLTLYEKHYNNTLNLTIGETNDIKIRKIVEKYYTLQIKFL